MEGDDQIGERTFRVNLGEDGAAKLAARLTDTLKDYMGEDFVDDTLVKYVIVLLGNGRRREEVKEDLDVFLGDKSDSFVKWLWDHLATNLDQYVGSLPKEVANAKPDLVDSIKDDSSNPVSESDRRKSSKTSRSRHNRGWKGIMTDDTQPPLRSTVTSHVRNEEKAYSEAFHARQSVSPERPVHRKRNRSNERSRPKREVSQSTIAAPRRLLQFAVRDAVGTTRPSSSVSEPVQKRLRSVVSTTIANSTDEVKHKRIQSIARPSSSMATAIKAVAEASKDVRRLRSGNVFDRLSRGDGSCDQVPIYEEFGVEDDEYDDYDHIQKKTRLRYLQTRNDAGPYHVNASMMDSSTGLASDSASDNEGYDDVNAVGFRGVDGSETGMSAKADDSLMLHYSVAPNSDEMTHQSRMKDQELPVSAANTKHKIVNISVNVNTWKPHHYQTARETPKVEIPKSTLETEIGASNSSRVMKENSNPVTVLGNGKPAADIENENQKTVGSSGPGPYSTGRPLEDADSRTIFVNNVHFAATKDTLSRHFNKFGEVLKVIILSDAATGHPKGSAYVEFMRKEAAENALTLDGTSFMSRIIKVVKKSSAQQEANPMMTWPRITRGSPFGVPRFAQAPFPRGFPGAYRARPPMKLGVRSMQWKRDTQQTPTDSVPSVPTTPGRGLTYIRPETKSDGNPSSV